MGQSSTLGRGGTIGILPKSAKSVLTCGGGGREGSGVRGQGGRGGSGVRGRDGTVESEETRTRDTSSSSSAKLLCATNH